jgi:proteic killer suppression protein
MIKSFRHKGLKRLFETGNHRGVRHHLAPRIRRQLDYLNAAKQIADMNLPGFNLHELKGKRKGIWAITVSGNWRITFNFTDGDAYDVNLEDYH